jgi:hypothetical protein
MSRTRKTHQTLELLAAARPAQLDVVDEARRQRDLAAILATPGAGADQGARLGRRGRGRRAAGRDAVALLPRRRRPLLRAGIAAALVAAVAGAAVVAPRVLPDRMGGHQVQAGGAGAGHPGQPSRSGQRGATPRPAADPQGRAFLLASADRILRVTPPPEGPYWYLRIRNTVVTSADAFSRHPRGLRFQVRIESTAESWMPKHRGTGHSVDPASLDDIEIGFPSARDKAAWRAAGSPKIDYPPAGVGRAEDIPGTILEAPLDGAAPLSVDQLLRLPTDPVLLEAKLRDLLSKPLVVRKVRKADGSVKVVAEHSTRRAPVTDERVFGTIAGWLAFAPLTPQLQAALYQVMAGLPGVRYQGPATDNSGRRGIAISWAQPTRDGDGQVVSDRFIVNPSTGELLGQEQVVVEPAPPSARGSSQPAGTVLSSQAILARHWTEGPGPGGWPTNPPGVIAPKG